MRGCHELVGLVVGQTGDRQLRETYEVRDFGLPLRITHREDHRHRLGPQPPRRKGEYLRRRTVQPLRVIDHAQQRPLARHLGEQAEHRQPDHESIRWAARAEPESRAQRLLVRTGQARQPVQHRTTDLVQGGVCELPFRLHTRGPRGPAT